MKKAYTPLLLIFCSLLLGSITACTNDDHSSQEGILALHGYPKVKPSVDVPVTPPPPPAPVVMQEKEVIPTPPPAPPAHPTKLRRKHKQPKPDLLDAS